MRLNNRVLFLSIVLSLILLPDTSGGWLNKTDKIKVACIGDSITFGARLDDPDKYSYPAQLQALLGENYLVENFGVGSCTLIRKGKPNVWTQLAKIKESNPEIVIISLGTNDTCGGTRACWDHKNDFPGDYRDLIDSLRLIPSKPRIYICAPSPMVLETPGLDSARIADLRERQPRLQELIAIVKNLAIEKKTNFIDLNTPMANKPELFTEKDGVHPNKAGYHFIAELVYSAVKDPKDLTPNISTDIPNLIHHSFAGHWEYVGIAVEEPGYCIWGASPIVGTDGRIHLFVERWPGSKVEPGWRGESEIAHYISDKPEGPFRFTDVALTGTGKETWDKCAVHNPTIHKVGDQYVLLYIGNNNPKIPPHPSNQCIGMAASKNLNGPWKRVGTDGRILSPSENPKFWNYKAKNGVNNPAFLQHPDGGFLLYFKSSDGKNAKMGLAIAENLEGPYVQLPFPVTQNEQTVEDGYAMMLDGKFCLLTTDNHGLIEKGGGILWKSVDGIHFDDKEQGFYPVVKYLGEEKLRNAVNYYAGNIIKFERPQVLLIEGKPAFLYVASGFHFFGGKSPVNYVMRFTN
jgi:lysophospholipase L1-like esterase